MQRTTLLGVLGAAALLSSATSAQYGASPITHNFLDIALTGAGTGLSGSDDAGVTIPLGFGFNFYGATVTSIGVSTNGYLTTGTDLTDFTPDCPSVGSIDPNGTIAPFFDDMTLTTHGEVYYQTFGVAPNRVAVVQWDNVAGFGSANTTSSLTFQAQLFENGNIQFHYAGLSAGSGTYPVLGQEAFIGVENSDASDTTEITCNSGSPFLTPNASAFQLDQSLPIISAPAEVVSGSTFNVTGLADPGTLYVFAWSLSNGPLGPIPTLGGITLDLGLNFKLAGTGLTPANGQIASDTLLAPGGFSGTTVYWQAITIGSFGPLGNINVSNSDSTQLQDGAVFTGTIVAGTSDSYSMPGTAGDVVSIFHCRTDNTGGSGSTLDNYLCLVDPSGVTERFNDDSGGDCYVTGPFGASEIVDHTLLQTGVYTIYATAYQGLAGAGAAGDYELTIIGSGAASTTLLADDGPICPGQPLLNPAAKLLTTQEVKPRR